MFNSCFAKVGKSRFFSKLPISKPDFSSNFGPISCNSMAMEPVSEIEISRLINGNNNSPVSSDPDYILTKVVKFVIPSIISPLTRHGNLSSEMEFFPVHLSALERLSYIKVVDFRVS